MGMRAGRYPAARVHRLCRATCCCRDILVQALPYMTGLCFGHACGIWDVYQFLSKRCVCSRVNKFDLHIRAVERALVDGKELLFACHAAKNQNLLVICCIGVSLDYGEDPVKRCVFMTSSRCRVHVTPRVGTPHAAPWGEGQRSKRPYRVS